MEMKILIIGAGIGIPKTGISVNLGTNALIQFRSSKNSTSTCMGISQMLTAGSEAGTVIFGDVDTDWFFVNPIKHKWAANTDKLVGKKVQLEVSGTLIVGGKVDVKFTVIDEHGNTSVLMSKVDIKASGIQAASTNIRGILKRMPTKRP